VIPLTSELKKFWVLLHELFHIWRDIGVQRYLLAVTVACLKSIYLDAYITYMWVLYVSQPLIKVFFYNLITCAP